MNYIKDIKLKEQDCFNMIIEIPTGTNKKFELVEPGFDRIECVRKVKGIYPYYYGCFPQTYAGDKDPLDCILLSFKKHKQLDIVKVQPIAVIKTIDNGEVDDKIICIPVEDKTIIGKRFDKCIKLVFKFLKKYKGKKSNMILDNNVYDYSEAIKLIDDANREYNRVNKKDETALKSF